MDPHVAAPWAAIAQQIDRDAQRVRSGTLQPACACFFRPSTLAPARGVVLMLHGFTAGPWQFEHLAAHLAQAGLHAYAARLPGHGACTTDGAPDSSELPKSNQQQLYTQCADQAFADARALAEAERLPLYGVGFSAGGALTIDLLQRYPEHIARAVLICPLVRFYGRVHHALFAGLTRMPISGRLTNRLRLAWHDAAPAAGTWTRPGHKAFFLGNVAGLAAYANQVHRLRRGLQVPCQFILTATDTKVDVAASVALAQRTTAPHSLWCFPRRAGLPHSMLTPHENPDAESRAKIYAITEDFLVHGRGHNQPPA